MVWGCMHMVSSYTANSMVRSILNPIGCLIANWVEICIDCKVDCKFNLVINLLAKLISIIKSFSDIFVLNSNPYGPTLQQIK